MGVLLLTCCITDTAGAEPVAASANAEVSIRTGVHATYDRIVFDWPSKIEYSFRKEGKNVQITFNMPAKFKQSAIENLTRITEFAVSETNDGKAQVFWKTAPNAIVKHFINERSVVVDIEGKPVLARDKATTAEPQQKQQQPQLQPTNEKSVKEGQTPPPDSANNSTESIPFKNQALTEQITSTPENLPKSSRTPEATNTPAPLPPTALATKAPVSPAQPPSPTPTPENQQQPQPLQLAAPTAPQQQAQAATQSAAVPFPAPATLTLTQTLKPTAAAPQPGNFPPAPKIAIGSSPVLVASLDPQTTARAAIWQRAGYGYIVFDRQFSMELAALTVGQPAPRIALEPLAGIKFSGYRFRMPYDALLLGQRDENIWKLYITRKKPDVPVSTALVAQPDFALGARMILPLPDAPETIRMIDPMAGDELVVVPLERAEIFGVKRQMADFEVLPAAQGLVIKPLNEKVLVRKVPDGIEIAAEGGLKLSRSSDTGAAMRSANRSRMINAGKSMFDFSTWQGKPGETFTTTRQRLQQAIVDVPESERNRARLELARFYFSRGYGYESKAILNWLGKQMPDLKAHADFVALLGATKIMAGRPEDGLKELDSSLFENQPEIALWQAVAMAEMRDWFGAQERFAIVQPMLLSYPEPFFSKFMLLAIESAMATDKYREAAEWLELLLNNSRPEDRNNAAIEYLRGAIHARANRYTMAEQAWKNAESMDDRLYTVRAELALLDLRVANKTLSPAKAANRLESLRFAWRGDDLEVDILHRLEQYYLQAGNVKMALGMLSRVKDLFPDSAYIPQMQSEMAQIFRDIFLGDLGKQTSPLDALTYYQQYRNLMPTGEKGIAVMRILAERLVAVDLLEQAGDILEDLTRNKLQGEEKTHVAARLAAIRILDRKPDKALAALDLVKDGNNGNADIRKEQTLLRAKALSEMRKYDEALELLREEDAQPAKILRAEIAMKAQKWPEAAKYLLQIAGPPPNEKTLLSRDQAKQLVNAAIALSLSGDVNAIDKLAIDYGPAMDKTAQSDTFRVLTQPDKMNQLQDLADVQSRLSDLDMFQGFLNAYRKPETPTATTSATPTAEKEQIQAPKAPSITPPTLTPSSITPERKPPHEETAAKDGH